MQAGISTGRDRAKATGNTLSEIGCVRMYPGSDTMIMPHRPRLLFVNKTARSTFLSHSEGSERIELLSTAQRNTRRSPETSNGATTTSRPARVARSQMMPATVTFAAINRVQLSAHFFDSYYPVCMPERAKVVNKLRQWMEPKRGVLALTAADSMILLHAAQTTGSLTVRKDGMLRYSKALQLLHGKLQNPKTAHDDDVLGTVEIMGVVETRLLKSWDCAVTGRVHTHGFQALILARGPLTLESNTGKDILLQHLHEPLMVSLLARKTSIFGSPDWQAAFQRSGGVDRGKMH